MKITGWIFRIKKGNGHKDQGYSTNDKVKFVKVNMVKKEHHLDYDLLDINLNKVGTGSSFCTWDLGYRLNTNWR